MPDGAFGLFPPARAFLGARYLAPSHAYRWHRAGLLLVPDFVQSSIHALDGSKRAVIANQQQAERQRVRPNPLVQALDHSPLAFERRAQPRRTAP